MIAHALFALALAACDSGQSPRPSMPPGSPVAPVPAPSGEANFSAIGRWQGHAVCLALFASGEFELSDLEGGSGPKVTVLGRYRLGETTGDRTALALEVDRIWRARYTGACRRVHEHGRFIDEQSFLGATLRAGSTTTVHLVRAAADRVQLCAEACADLERAEPTLGHQWRADWTPQADDPDRFRSGDVIVLSLLAPRPHLAVLAADRTLTDCSGTIESRSLGAERFEVTFTPQPNDPRAAALSIMGHGPGPDARWTFLATRRPGGLVDLCIAERCVSLHRDLDPSSHEL
jgi:hypothetical protein